MGNPISYKNGSLMRLTKATQMNSKTPVSLLTVNAETIHEARYLVTCFSLSKREKSQGTIPFLGSAASQILISRPFLLLG